MQDRRTDGVKPIYPPTILFCGGIITWLKSTGTKIHTYTTHSNAQIVCIILGMYYIHSTWLPREPPGLPLTITITTEQIHGDTELTQSCQQSILGTTQTAAEQFQEEGTQNKRIQRIMYMDSGGRQFMGSDKCYFSVYFTSCAANKLRNNTVKSLI